LYSSSFQGAKVIVNVKSGLLAKLKMSNNAVSLRFCFQTQEKGNPVTFFVASKIAGSVPYKNSKDVLLLSLQFTQRPPDDLIEVIGRVLDANVNSSKRRGERIYLSDETMRKIKLLSRESAAFIQGVPRRCILRDLAFSGSKLIMLGVAKFLVDKEAGLRFDFDDPRESFLVKGKFVSSENVEGKKEMVALAMDFDEAAVPMGYKIRLNDYFNTIRADNRVPGGESAASAKVPKPEEKKPGNAAGEPAAAAQENSVPNDA
jgi:hypothetical protein